MTAGELADRRQRAREAYYDSTMARGAPEGSAIALEQAIETATRVRITPEIEAVAEQAAGEFFGGRVQRRAIIVAAFRAAGFEVEE